MNVETNVMECYRSCLLQWGIIVSVADDFICGFGDNIRIGNNVSINY